MTTTVPKRSGWVSVSRRDDAYRKVFAEGLACCLSCARGERLVWEVSDDCSTDSSNLIPVVLDKHSYSVKFGGYAHPSSRCDTVVSRESENEAVVVHGRFAALAPVMTCLPGPSFEPLSPLLLMPSQQP